MQDDRPRLGGAVHAGAFRGRWRYDPVATAEETPAHDPDADHDTPKVTEAMAANGIVAAEAEPASSPAPDENARSKEPISCTISDGNGGTATVSVAIAASCVADMRHMAIRLDLPTRELAPIEISDMVASPVDDDRAETLKVEFNGLPSGSVISHPEAIAKKNAELVMLSNKIAALQIEIAANEQTRLEKNHERQELINAGGPQEDIDMLSTELEALEDLTKLKAAQKSVAEIDRDIALFEGQQLTQTAGASGTASFHGPCSGYVLQLPDSTVDGYSP